MAVVRNARLDAENEGRPAVEGARQIDLDRRPSVAVNGDRDVVDEDHGFVEDAFHDEDDAPVSRPVGRDLDPATLPPGPLSVAQGGELRLPDPRRPDAMALAVQSRSRALEGEVPLAVETEAWAQCGRARGCQTMLGA